MAAGAARWRCASRAGRARDARLRYVDALRGEIPRLCDGLDAIQAHATTPLPSHEACDIATIVQDIVRDLHDEAVIREIGLAADGCDDPVTARGDPRLLRLALLSLTVAMLDVTAADGGIRLRVEPARDDAYGATIAIATSHPGRSARARSASRLGARGIAVTLQGMIGEPRIRKGQRGRTPRDDGHQR